MSPDEVGPPGTTPGGTDTNTSSHQETDTGQFTDGDGAGEGWEGYLRYTNPDDGGHISPEHLAMLAERAISAEFAWNRYETIVDRRKLVKIKLAKDAQRLVPGLYIPWLDIDGNVVAHQYRPDLPRHTGKKLKPCKYEMPHKQPNRVHFPPGVDMLIGDPAYPLFIAESALKADCLADHGLCAVGVNGVWGFRGSNDLGGTALLADFHDIPLNNGRPVIIAYDSDLATNPDVRRAAAEHAAVLRNKGSRPLYLHLPPGEDGEKIGVDDYLADGHTVEELQARISPTLVVDTEDREDEQDSSPEPQEEPVDPISLGEAHEMFCKWLGKDYDTDALDAVLAAAAVEQFNDGSDPLWILVISGSGAAKTETVQALRGIRATITSSISSEAALLSATPRKDRSKTATGGLLREIGKRGVLVIKDVTSILSMNSDHRNKVLAALREVYDGYWCRHVGADGGGHEDWSGRIAVVGAVTTAWDAHHSVIAMMGDRFITIRIDSSDDDLRLAAAYMAIDGTGLEEQMRADLRQAVAGAMAGASKDPVELTQEEKATLVAAANLVSKARTSVEFDYHSNVTLAHATEMPTRIVKQLTQVLRGAVAIGKDRGEAMELALRCARDTVPPLRLAIIEDLAKNPDSPTRKVSHRLDRPWATVDRQLKALHAIRLVTVWKPAEREEGEDEATTTPKTDKRWRYSLATGVDPEVLKNSLKKSPHTSGPPRSSDTPAPTHHTGPPPSGADAPPSGVGVDIFDEFGEPDDTTERDPPKPSPGPWDVKFAKLREDLTTVGRCYICQQEKLINPQTSVCIDCTRLARAEGPMTPEDGTRGIHLSPQSPEGSRDQ